MNETVDLALHRKNRAANAGMEALRDYRRALAVSHEGLPPEERRKAVEALRDAQVVVWERLEEWEACDG